MIILIRQIKVLVSFENCKQFLPRNSLLAIYKSFIRPLLDYADVIYDQPSNSLFSKKSESVQQNAALAITGLLKAPLVKNCTRS